MNGPKLVQVESEDVVDSPEVRALIEHYRSQANAFVFLSGGASNMSDSAKKQLLRLFSCFDDLVSRHVRFAVADGGTQAGIMEAAGLARKRNREAFLLLGVVPAPDITLVGEPGKTPVDPNHSHVISVNNVVWAESQRDKGWEPGWGYWGSETEAMYNVFGRMAERRPSMTVVANGGGITLDEVEKNIRQKRALIVIADSGRAADAIINVLRGTDATDEEIAKHQSKAKSIGVAENRELFHILPLDAGPNALAQMLLEQLES